MKPATGVILWEDCLNFDARGSLTAVPGVVEVAMGQSFMLVNAQTGTQLFTYKDTNLKSNFLGPGGICNGVLYQGNWDGMLYAFTPQA